MPDAGARSLTAAQQDEIRQLRKQGLGYRRISRETGVPVSTVIRYVRRGPDPDPRGVWDLDKQPYGPAEHGLAKRALGLRQVTDTYVLSKTRDPFYCGMPAQIRDGHWFGQLWRDLGMPDGSHTRRVHYRADARQARKPDGSLYTNSEADWGKLSDASIVARTLDQVDAERVADHRSGGVSANVPASRYTDGTPGVQLLEADGDEWDGWLIPQAWLPGTGVLSMPQPSVSGYGHEIIDQPVLVEVWCEKSTVDDILVPLCDRLGVNLASEAKGYESITHIIQMLRRAEAYPGRRAVVLYISDNDHSGLNMPVQVARQCQFWAAKLGIKAQVLVHPIALTDEQVAEFGLPRAPDSKDRLRTELDALEAIRPGELARIVEAEVACWRDPGLADALAETEADAQEQASGGWETRTAELAAGLAEIRAEAESIISSYQPVIAELNRRLRDGPGQRLDGLTRRVRQAAVDGWDLPERPGAADPEIPGDILYDSSRHWLDQLQAYRAARGQPPLDLNGGTQ